MKRQSDEVEDLQGRVALNSKSNSELLKNLQEENGRMREELEELVKKVSACQSGVEGKEEEVVKAYERAVENVPPSKEKRFWRRYIYFWIYYAVYLELDVDEVEKARDVYKRCIQCIPNKAFTFGKVRIGPISVTPRFGFCTPSLKSARIISTRRAR